MRNVEYTIRHGERLAFVDTLDKHYLEIPLTCIYSYVSHESSFLTHLCLMDSSTFTLQTSLFPILGVLLLCFIEIPVCNANSVDPNQTPHFAISEDSEQNARVRRLMRVFVGRTSLIISFVVRLLIVMK